MAIGRSTPRYQELAEIYPESKRLRKYMCEYFVVVVKFCQDLFKFAKKSPLGQFASSLNDANMKTYQSEFDSWAKVIGEEAKSLLGRRVHEQTQASSTLNNSITKFFTSQSNFKQRRVNRLVLESCSKYDYETTWKQIRKVGTTTLFHRGNDYRNWRDASVSSTLVYNGKLGSGKSVLLANIVADLDFHNQNNSTAVAYFFSRYDILQSLKARTILGSLARQLLLPLTDLMSLLDVIEDSVAEIDLVKIFNRLKFLPRDYKAYVILDGLHECEPGERNIVLEELRRLQDNISLFLCISTMLEPNSPSKMRAEKLNAYTVTMPDDNPDIESFIGVELKNCLESGKLVIGNRKLESEIQDALIKGSHGMFLWVALQIQSLCTLQTDHDIRDALSNLPQTLSETYARVLRQSKTLGYRYQRPLLELVTTAQRPLTTEELREALSVIPGNTTWDPEKHINSIYAALSCCGSVIAIDEEELTVRFVHHSVKQFLLGAFRDSEEVPITLESANLTMAHVIITYLNFDIFENQLTTRTQPTHLVLQSISSSIIRSSFEARTQIKSVALKLLGSKKIEYDIGNVLAETSQPVEPNHLSREMYFLSYTKSFAIQHIMTIPEEKLENNNLLLKLYKKRTIDWNVPVEHGRTPLVLAAKNGQQHVFQLLLSRDDAQLEWIDENGLNALSWASRNGHDKIVDAILRVPMIGISHISLKDEWGRTALSWAAAGGHTSIAKALVANECDWANLDLWDQGHQTPLSWAAEKGHEKIVLLLLGHSNVNPDSRDIKGRTPLSWAARNGHEKVVELLVASRRVDINSQDDDKKTPLSYAVARGHGGVQKLLVGEITTDEQIMRI